jgi:dethiobiotin synthetase
MSLHHAGVYDNMHSQQHLNGLFVTGSDTGVGKTYISALLIRALHSRSIPVEPRKPVESGCSQSPDGTLIPADGIALLEAAGLNDLDEVTPYRFSAPLAPPQAAAREGQEIRLKQLVNSCPLHNDSLLIVEGAGGFLSPIASDGLNADLAIALGLPVVLVVADRLGCINHCLLTIEAIEHRGLAIAGIILNQISGGGDMQNFEEIKRRVDCPVYLDRDIEAFTDTLFLYS